MRAQSLPLRNLLVAGACIVLLLSPMVPAQEPSNEEAPANDMAAHAHVLKHLPASWSQSTEGATLEPGEPTLCADGLGATVWFRFTARGSGVVTAATANSGFYTLLTAYDADLPQIPVACNSQDESSFSSTIEFPVVDGRSYLLQAGGWEGGVGRLQLEVRCRGCDREARNDDVSRPTVIGRSPFSSRVPMGTAGVEPGEPQPCGAPALATVWYAFSPATDTVAHLKATGGEDDAPVTLALSRGRSFEDLSLLACGDATSALAVPLEAGAPYLVQIASAGREAGLAFHCDPACFSRSALPQDDIEGARHVDAPRMEVRTVGATVQPGEPLPCGRMGSTAWFVLTSRSLETGRVRITTQGSDYDTVLAVYEAPQPSGFEDLTLLRCSDDHEAYGVQSAVTFDAIPGMTYYVQVGGFAGLAGNAVLRISGTNLVCSTTTQACSLPE